jgi:chemotaxis protein CheZ
MKTEQIDGLVAEGLGPRVKGVMADLLGDLGSINLRLYGELEKLAKLIETMKTDIASIREGGTGRCDIPGASDELDAVVGATEDAAGTILDAAETIEGVAAAIDPVQAQILQDAVARIYEACSFQDLAGQRITKVVRTLRQVEEGLVGLLHGFGGAIPIAPSAIAADAQDARPDAALMNGPQLPSKAARQDEIDALLASFG